MTNDYSEFLCKEFDTNSFLVYKWFPNSCKTLEKYIGNETDIILPEGIERVKENVFWHYDELESITFPKTIKTLDGHTLIGLKNLKRVVFQECQIENIPECFFFGTGITEVILPKSIKTIGESAFSCCNRLERISLPDSVETIERFVFHNCENLRQVIIGRNCKKINPRIFDGGNTSTVNAVLYYPDDFQYIDKIPQNIKAMPLSKLKRNDGKGCYVATCIYGSYDCPAVWTLRRYRDNTLAQNSFGRLFVRTYYAISPTIVKLFGNQLWFHKLFKRPLDKIVEKLKNNGVENTPYND